MFPASPATSASTQALIHSAPCHHASHALSPTTCQGANSVFCALDLDEHVLVVCTGDVVAELLTAILSKERRPEPIIGGAVSKKPLSIEELDSPPNFSMVIKSSDRLGTAEFFGAHSSRRSDASVTISGQCLLPVHAWMLLHRRSPILPRRLQQP